MKSIKNRRIVPATIRRSSHDSREGTILFFAVAVLMGLLLFAVAFVRVSSVERTASNHYMQRLDSRSIARAGLHRAISELRKHYETHSYDDSRKTGSGSVFQPNDPWCYYDRYYRDTFYVSNANSSDTTKQSGPLGLQLTPNISFRNRALIDGSEIKIQRAGMATAEDFYISGNMGRTSAGGLKNYRLKILDCASMLHINNEDSFVMQRMLKNLLRARFALNDSDADAIAQRVRERRPGGGYLTKEEVGSVIRDSGSAQRLSETQWDLLKDDITCFAWTDNKVIVPPLTRFTTGTTTVTGGVGRSEINDPTLNASLELTERAPVNINTASQALLISVFADVQGVITKSNRSYNHDLASPTSLNPAVVTSIVKTLEITFANAEEIAEKIMDRRNATGTATGPFKSWFEFETWLDTTTISGVSAEKKDLIKAMVNPNTDIAYHKFASEGNHNWRWVISDDGQVFLPSITRVVDKTDLTQITTELCFSSMGWFEITSLGQIWDSGEAAGSASSPTITFRKVLSEQSVQTVVRVYDVLRLSTQRDFERDRVYSDPKMYLNYTQNAQSAAGYKYHGFSDLADKPSDANLLYAWPATLTQPEYTNRHLIPSSAATSPSALAITSGANRVTVDPEYSLADYDGSIILNGLARVETKPNDFLVGFSRGSMRPIKTRVHKTERGADIGPVYAGKSEADILRFYERVGSDQVLNNATKVSTTNLQGRRSLLNPGSSFADLFHGSALTNLGALITDDRENYLVYDGDNLSLKDSTVHFWVKPVKEYYWSGTGKRKISDDKQVLFSWLGGFEFKTGTTVTAGANLRDGGFEIVRVRQGDIISLKVNVFGLQDRGRFAQTTSTLFDFPVAFVQEIGGEEFYSKSSLWRVGAWNHVQFSFGVDRDNGRYTGTLIVNSQYMPGGFAGLGGTQGPVDGSGVRHGFVMNRDHVVFNNGRAVRWNDHSSEVTGVGVAPARTNSLSGTGFFGTDWYIDRLFYDYYYCSFDGIDTVSTSVEDDLPFKVLDPDEFGQYLPGLGISSGGLFTATQNNPEVIVRFEASSHSPANPTIPGEGSCHAPSSHPASIYPTNSERNPNPTDWYYKPTDTVRNNKLKLKFYKRYTESTRIVSTSSLYTSSQTFCSDYALTSRDQPDQFDPPARNQKKWHCWNEFPTPHGKYTFDECDDCEGCEACDIDGPVFIGAELSYPASQGSVPILPATTNAQLSSNNSPSTVKNDVVDTYKVFHFGQCMIDNLYLLGYRVDEHGSDPDAEHLVNMPSDRFYDSDVSQLNSTTQASRGHKPGYKRNLTELFARRIKLGTVTWSGYPGFNRIPIGEAAPDGTAAASYNPVDFGNLDKTDLLSTSLTPVTVSILKWDLTATGQESVDYVSPPASQGGAGLSFEAGIISSSPLSAANTDRSYNSASAANRFDPDRGGSGITVINEVDRNIRSGDILVLTVDFAPTTSTSAGTYQTPVLNDVTITYFTEPKVIYTEEGQMD